MKKAMIRMLAIALALLLAAGAGTAEKPEESNVGFPSLQSIVSFVSHSVDDALETGTKKVLNPLCEGFQAIFGGNDAAEDASQETIPLWKADSPAMQSIVQFVQAITDETSPDYIPPEKRVAVFDLDGTLMGERFPIPSMKAMLLSRLLEGDVSEEDAAFAKEMDASILNHTPAPEFPRSSTKMLSGYFAGKTVEEYQAYIRNFLQQPVQGFVGMTYENRFFAPMVRLVEYLAAHEIQVFICSGTERLFVREQIAKNLGQWIPPYRVIGTTFSLTATNQGEMAGDSYTYTAEDQVLMEGTVESKALKMNKVNSIIQEIGVTPVMVFGNSSGDYAMGTYCVQHGGRAYMLLCDDLQRDYGDPEEAAACAESCVSLGFEAISMRAEFETIYEEGIEIETIEEEAVADAA